jgi:hypothetical protein
VPTLANLPADCEAILGEFVTALEAAGIDLSCRKYVNPGNLVAWDEQQLTIAVARIYMGEPGMPVGSSLIAGQFHQSVSFGLLYLFPVPGLTGNGAFPATADLDAAGKTTAEVASIFWEVAVNLRVTDKLSPGGGSVVIGPLSTMGPEGGLAGIALQLDMSLL